MVVFRLSGGFLYDPGPLNSATAAERNQITVGGLPFTPSRGGAAPGALNFNAYTPYAGLRGRCRQISLGRSSGG